MAPPVRSSTQNPAGDQSIANQNIGGMIDALVASQ